MNAPPTGVESGWSPRSEDGVTRRGCDCFLGGREQFSSDEPTDGGLHGTFRNSDGLREFAITDLNHSIATLLFRGKP